MRKGILAGILATSLASYSGCGELARINVGKDVSERSHNLTLCQDRKYDLDTRCVEYISTLRQMEKSVYEVQKWVYFEPDASAPQDFKKYFKDKVKTFFKSDMVMVGGGSGIMLDGNYMLSAAHVFGATEPMQLTFQGKTHTIRPVFTTYYVNIEDKLYEAKVEATGTLDAALLKVRNVPSYKRFPNVKLGKDSEMFPGQVIYAVGNNSLAGVQMKKGEVTRAKMIERFGRPIISQPGKHFFFDARAGPGDSGGAIYSIRDGEPELTGLIVMVDVRTGHIGIGLGIESIIKDLYKPLKARKLL
ncbi:MAG: serine protease [Candidatus Woesearchaeota archaeon]